MRTLLSLLFLVSSFSVSSIEGQAIEKVQVEARPKIYLQPNTTQIFTELYQEYGLQRPTKRTFFEEALYLDQSIPPTKIPLQPANEEIFDHASAVLKQFHTNMHDLELYIDPQQTKNFFYTAVGSKHLIVALVYGIVMSHPETKFLFVEQIPYYSGHPNAVNGIFQYPNARFLGFHDPSEIRPEPGVILVEFVTSPNNPDGLFRKPLTNASIIIGDFVFASSAFGSDGTGYLDKNIEWVRQARATGRHVFSFNSASKQFGKTGLRCGYMWYPIYDLYAASVFDKFFGFISSSTVAGGSSGLAEFLDLIKALIDLPDGGAHLRDDARNSLAARHQLVEKEFIKRYPGSDVLSIPGSPTFFAKMRDKRVPAKMASEVLVDDLDAVVNNGAPMGEDNAFIRLNLSGYSEVLAEFLNRLAKKKEYIAADLLFSSVNKCGMTKVIAEKGKKTSYIVRPSDCKIDVDASQGAIEINLVPFIDYLGTVTITIHRTDPSAHAVEIVGRDIKISLKAQGEQAQLEWSQPLYLNGKWQRKEEP